MIVYILYALLVAGWAGWRYLSTRNRFPPGIDWAGHVGLAAAITALLLTRSRPASFLHDFHTAYLPAGHLVRNSPASLYPVAEPAAGYVNIPIVAWLFVPFDWMSRSAADTMLVALSVVAVLAAYAGLVSLAKLQGASRFTLAALFVVNGPLFNSLREGNLTHFILLLLVGALWCMQTRRDVWFGVALAVAAVIKPPLLLLALPFLLRRGWGFATGFSATLGGAAAISVAAFGFHLHRLWYERTVQPFSRHPLGTFNVQSLDGFLARLLGGGEHLTDWNAINTYGTTFLTVRFAIVAAIVGVAATVLWRSRSRATVTDLRLDFSIALCLSLVVGPISWAHYYLLMLIPIAFYLGGQLAVPLERPWNVATWCAVALMSPPVLLLDPHVALVGPMIVHVLVSNYFYGGVLLLGVMLAARSREPADEEYRAPAHEAARSLEPQLG